MKERKLIKRAGKVLKSKMCTVVSGAGQVQSRPSSVVVAYFPAMLAGQVCTRMESRPRLGLPRQADASILHRLLPSDWLTAYHAVLSLAGDCEIECSLSGLG